jgi:outer membrane protein
MSFMKKVVLVVAVATAFVSAEMKIGYVDSQRIMSEYTGTKVAEDKIKTYQQKLEQQATNKQKKIKQMEEDIQKQQLLLSEEKKQQLMKEYQDSVISYQQFVQEKLGQQGEVAQKIAELQQPIIDKIKKTIDEVAVSENYDFVFDKTVSVLYGKKSYDLTDKVILKLNSGK